MLIGSHPLFRVPVPNHIPERQRAFQVRTTATSNVYGVKLSESGKHAQADPRLVHQKMPRARLYHGQSSLVFFSLLSRQSPSVVLRTALSTATSKA